MKVGSGVLRAVGLVVGSSVLVSTIGFLKGVLAASYFGTSGGMDAYFVALLLPDLVTRFVLSGFFNFVPLFVEEQSRSEDAAWLAASKMLACWFTMLMVVVAVGYAFAEPLVALIAQGFEGAQLQTTVELCRILFLMTASVGIAEIIALPLVAQRRFLSATASQVAFQLSSTAFLVAFRSWGISSFAWGMAFGGFTQLLVICLGLGPDRSRLRLDFDLRSTVVRRMFRLTLPTYVGTAGARLNGIVNRGFASLLPAGGVSSIQYAYMLAEAPITLLATPVTKALFPYMSTQFAQGERRARENVNRALFSVAVVFAPITLGAYLLATPLVQCLFERGSFDARSTELTAGALMIYAPSILALGLSRLIVGSFGARQDTTTPMRAGLVRVAVNAALCLVLVPRMGHLGIALSNTLAECVKLLLLGWVMWRSLPHGEGMGLARPFLRLLPPLACMGLAVYPLAERYLTARGPWLVDALALSGVVGAGVVAYFVALALFCRQDVGPYWGLLRERLRFRERLARLAAGRPRP